MRSAKGKILSVVIAVLCIVITAAGILLLWSYNNPLMYYTRQDPAVDTKVYISLETDHVGKPTEVSFSGVVDTQLAFNAIRCASYWRIPYKNSLVYSELDMPVISLKFNVGENVHQGLISKNHSYIFFDGDIYFARGGNIYQELLQLALRSKQSGGD